MSIYAQWLLINLFLEFRELQDVSNDKQSTIG